MAQPNYTLKLTLKQANITRRALEEHLAKLAADIEPMFPTDGQALRQEYKDTELLLRDM